MGERTSPKAPPGFTVPVGNNKQHNMAPVFISYSSQQLSFAEQLEAELESKGIKAWRDKTNLHAGERWPKALGEAIADSDALVLLWSGNAKQSDFVELEWNIAVAMEKPVMPCLLDETELPPTLKPSHRIPGKNIQQAAEQIMAAIKGLPPAAPSKQQEKLLETLDTVPAAEPQQVLKNLNAVINQPNWSVGGNVYQAQGDIHIISDTDKKKKPESTKIDNWIKWVGLGVASLTLVGLLLDLPTKIMNLTKGSGQSESQGLEKTQSETKKEPQQSNLPVKTGNPPQAETKSKDRKSGLSSSSQPLTTRQPKPTILKLSGVVTDQVTGEPLEGAKVAIPSLKKVANTDAQGFFAFRVNNVGEKRLLVVVQKDQYETYRAKATLGNTDLGFVLRRKP